MPITSWSATDYNPICRRVLQSFKPEHGPKHIFGDLMSRIPKEVLNDLFDIQTKFIQEFNDSVCTTPGKSKRQELNRVSEKFLKEALELLGKTDFPVDATAWCYKCNAFCRIKPPPHNKQLVMEVGGNTCTPWSTAGLGRGWLDPVSLPCLVWLHQQRAFRPHWIINECSPSFDTGLMTRVMEGVMTTETLTFSPLDMGIPASRPRRYSIMSSVELAPRRFPSPSTPWRSWPSRSSTRTAASSSLPLQSGFGRTPTSLPLSGSCRCLGKRRGPTPTRTKRS